VLDRRHPISRLPDRFPALLNTGNISGDVMKICTKCKVDKELSEFGVNKQYKDGLNSACKDCANARLRAYYAANKEACNAKSKRWQQAHPERIWAKAHPEKAKASLARYRAENRDRIKADNHEYRKKNSEKESLRHKKYAENNRIKIAEKESRRRDVIKIATPSWAKEIRILEFYKRAKRMTASGEDAYEVDHIIPLSGFDPQTNVHIVCGLHVESNLQILLAVEHRRKGCREWPGMA